MEKILEGAYKPEPAVHYKIAKENGGIRDIMVFAIPDAAVATLFHKRITERNLNLLSANCFSYRPDRNIFDAVLQVKSALSDRKVYVVQYDFSKYFDSIHHSYIQKIVNDRNSFIITTAERAVITSLLTHRYATRDAYTKKDFTIRTMGVPQGCSLSLVLSNVAAHELDKALEISNGQFVRFADDVLAIAYSYDDALRMTTIFNDHCKLSGISINHEKSPGIMRLNGKKGIAVRRFFVEHGEGDRISAINEFDYLGHKFRHDQVLMSTRALRRIKRRISKIIHLHLLRSPRSQKLFSTRRIGQPFFDWDLVTCLNEIRRYAYGELFESQINAFLEHDVRLPKVRGLMSFYPLVTSLEQLSMLDGWLLSVLRRALREREKALAALGVEYSRPKIADLIDGKWYAEEGIKNETQLPSFVRGWRAARKYYFRYGLKDIKPPSYYSILMSYL
ncbi:MAG TPA: reverse transcriptase domain-containing protein [Rhizomicrobium sp.]|nr:reverse transcriptase domain-containing protein [Rhizomicrobium sp.]